MEYWKIVPNTNGMYQASNYGNFKSLKSGEWKQIFPFKSKLVYLLVDFMDKCKRDRWKVHRIIAIMFVPNPNNYKMINHKDGNKLNNHDDNLEWCTASQNIQHAWDTGLKTKNYGEKNHNAILTQIQADEIRELRKAGMLQNDICKKYNISLATCQRILYNKIYLS